MRFFRKLPGLLVGLTIAFGCSDALPDDIDIFTGQSAGTSDDINVLIILDNTANWSQQAQHWPGGEVQGQSETLAIKNVINTFTSASQVNIGLELINRYGGGYIRYNISPMSSATNRANFSTILDHIYNNIDTPDEKVPQTNSWGDLWWDAYNYLGGRAQSAGGAAPPTGLGDPNAYTSQWTPFKSPLTAANVCANTVIIFIGNSGPASAAGRSDSTANGTALVAANGTISPELQMPNFTNATSVVTTNLGYTNSCYSSPGSCSTSDYAACAGTPNASFDSCACNSSDSVSALASCAAGTQRYDVTATGGSTSTTSSTSTYTVNGTSGCYSTSGSCGSAASGGSENGGLSCPANTDTGIASNPRVVTTYSCSYACGTTGGGSCPNTAGTPTTSTSSSSASSSGASTGCYATSGACGTAVSGGTERDSLTCPSNTALSPATCSTYPCVQTTTTHSCSYGCGTTAGAACTVASGSTITVTACSATQTNKPATDITACTDSNSTSPSGCDSSTPKCPPDASHTYTCPGSTSVSTASQTFNGTTCTGSGANAKWPISRTMSYGDTGNRYSITQTDNSSTTTKTTPGIAAFTFGVVQTVNKTVTTTTNTASSNVLGNTAACYSSLATCSTADYSQCSVAGTTCACTGSGTSGGSCPNSGVRYQVTGSASRTIATPTGTYSAATPGGVYTDEWAKMLHQIGVPAPGSTSGTTVNRSVTVYTIDVYHDKQDATTTSLLLNTAAVTSGKYFAATNYSDLVGALNSIFAEIQAINSAFASASLPVSATARAQDKNEVFIGMFRPDPGARPRWFGNLKQYKVVRNSSSGAIELGDVNGATALNATTGFITDCAKSFWTSDETPPYWSNVASNPPARGACTTATTDKFSDSPDGSLVEKGATAEVIRKGNAPPGTDSSPTYTWSRTLKSISGGALTDFATAASAAGLASKLIAWVSGMDVGSDTTPGVATSTGTREISTQTDTNTRPSLHGDVVHSRPLAVDYGTGTGGTVIYYGSNDGVLHATDGATGKEKWGFIAPEFFSRLQRLRDNSPQINYPGMPAGIIPSPTKKDYFWDGLIGLYQTADNSKIWIYPSMRRGGRMIYGLDVSPSGGTAPTAPVFKWRFGCPNLTNDTGCAAAAGDAAAAAPTSMGQTWSVPNVAFIKGYSSGTAPVIVAGGGYDACEDTDSTTPPCSTPKGNVVFILDGNDGKVLRSFATSRSVAADIDFIDVDLDGKVDYGYVTDVGGSIYRIDFIDGPTTRVALDKTQWTMHKVAATSGLNHKFLFDPALFQANVNTVYVALGSGDREHPLSSNYPFTTPVVNRFYVFKDDLTSTSATPVLDLDGSSMVPETTRNTCGDAVTVLPASAQKGWYLDLTRTGEQVVTSPLIEAGFVDFSTNRAIDTSGGSCATPLGEARGYKLNLFNGSGVIGATGLCGGDRSVVFAGGGLPPSPVLATVTVNGKPVTVTFGAASKDSSCLASGLANCEVKLPISAKRRPVYWYKSSGDQ